MGNPSKKNTLLKQKDLSVTALYTSQTWVWGQFQGAQVYETDQSKGVFGMTNLALLLMKIFKWKMPSLHHSLVQRHTLIDSWLTQHKPSKVIELASGLSARSLRFIHQVDQYLEVDLSHMIDFKKSCLAYEEHSLLLNPKMNWIDFDLKKLSQETLTLWIQDQVSTVIAEGLMMYLTQEQQHQIWRQLALALPSNSLLLFDLVPAQEQAPPGWFGKALGWCMRQFTGGQSFIKDQRSRLDIITELQECGFKKVEIFDVSNPVHQQQFQLPFPHKNTQNLIFVACT